MTKSQILQAFLDEVWSRGDVEACDLYLADAYLIAHDPGDPGDGQTLSLDGFKDRVRRSRAPCPDQAFHVQAMVEGADCVVATWLWTATHQGELAGFAPTGRPLSMSGITLYRFDGDRICGHWQVVDRLGVFQQLAAP